MKDNKGFTLVETLVTVGLLSVIGLIISGVLFVTLRSGGKAELEMAGKQKGEFALNSLEKMIRGAKEIKDITTRCSPAGVTDDSITLIGQDDLETTLTCAGTSIASSSANSTTLLQGVTTLDCDQFITCVRTEPQKPLVTIDFTIGLGSATAQPDKRAEIHFTSKVSMRNY
ncbi:MAG: prepilin-type N-terminal cleavage/methylation domain-containing protein [Patescibacteria group bacterium]